METDAKNFAENAYNHARREERIATAGKAEGRTSRLCGRAGE
jgi:hypothetical protein